jgi:hypothetical protein
LASLTSRPRIDAGAGVGLNLPAAGVGGEAAEGVGGREHQAEKLLAESMMDVSTLREMLGRNF